MSIVAPKARKHLSADALFHLVRSGFATIPAYLKDMFGTYQVGAIHGRLIVNPGVPVWWPAFCGAYDVVAAAYLAFLLLRPRQEQGA